MAKIAVTTLFLLGILVLFDVSSAKRQRSCPNKIEKFQQRMMGCYTAISSPDMSTMQDPTAVCRLYKKATRCIERWINRCSDKPWMSSLEGELTSGVESLKTMISLQCPN